MTEVCLQHWFLTWSSYSKQINFILFICSSSLYCLTNLCQVSMCLWWSWVLFNKLFCHMLCPYSKRRSREWLTRLIRKSWLKQSGLKWGPWARWSWVSCSLMRTSVSRLRNTSATSFEWVHLWLSMSIVLKEKVLCKSDLCAARSINGGGWWCSICLLLLMQFSFIISFATMTKRPRSTSWVALSAWWSSIRVSCCHASPSFSKTCMMLTYWKKTSYSHGPRR